MHGATAPHRASPFVGDDAPRSPADMMVPVRLIYSMRANLRVYVQVVRIAAPDVEDRLFDCILQSWGRSKRCNELEFVIAQEGNGEALATAEGLSLYCQQKRALAADDVLAGAVDA